MKTNGLLGVVLVLFRFGSVPVREYRSNLSGNCMTLTVSIPLCYAYDTHKYCTNHTKDTIRPNRGLKMAG
jgi:hypothetical protein